MYEEKRAELMANAERAVSEHRFEDFENIKADIEKLDNEHEQEARAQANLRALSKAPKPSAATMGGAGTVNLGGEQLGAADDENNVYASTEYRRAFMNMMVSGKPIKLSNSDAVTATSDVGAVIPTTIVRRIIEKMEVKSHVELFGPLPRGIFHRVTGNDRSLILIGRVSLLARLEIRTAIQVHRIHIHIIWSTTASGLITSYKSVGGPEFQMGNYRLQSSPEFLVTQHPAH